MNRAIVHIFRFSIALVSFSRASFISANIDSGLEAAPNLRKFLLTALCEIAAKGVVCRPVLDGALFHEAIVYTFRLSIALASFSYTFCIGANTIPG